MDVIVIDSEAFQALQLEIKLMVKAAVAEAINDKRNQEGAEWLSLSEAQKLLPYRSKTSWQKFRDQGIIEFTQSGRKILYSRKSILHYLLKNQVK